MIRFEVTTAEAGERLDQFLARRERAIPRTRWRRAIERGEVLVNGAAGSPSKRLSAGDLVTGESPGDLAPVPPEALPVDVIHEEESFLVVDKPAGLVVHPSSPGRRGTLVNRLVARYGSLSTVGGELRPGIVHRLDGTTSGVLVVARDDDAHRELARQFAARVVEKTYHAIAAGRMELDADVLAHGIRRHPRVRDRMSASRDEGRPARSVYRVLERYRGFTLVEVHPETGRTHQIRLQLRTIGHPIVGDRKYGGPVVTLGEIAPEAGSCAPLIDRAALHAYAIRFAHPRSGEPVAFHAPWPEDFAQAVEILRARRRED
ncbi:MAG: RluA family pseudouridine synthase [Planctomycetota bacterium]